MAKFENIHFFDQIRQNAKKNGGKYFLNGNFIFFGSKVPIISRTAFLLTKNGIEGKILLEMFHTFYGKHRKTQK